MELFDRSTIPLRLTPAGECFVEAGRRMIDMEHQLQKQLSEIKQNKNSTIRLGISPSRAPYLMPTVISTYRQINPSAKIVIKERTTAELSRMLACGDLDLIISLLDEESRSFERIDLFEEDLMLALPQALYHPDITAQEVLTMHTLITVGRGLALWQTMHEILATLNVAEPEIECQSIDSALSLVRKGMGATIVPSYVAQYASDGQNESIRFLKLPTDLFAKQASSCRRTVCLFYRKEQFLTEAERQLIDCVRKEGAEQTATRSKSYYEKENL